MSPGEHFKNVYKAIPLPVFVLDTKKREQIMILLPNQYNSFVFLFFCLFGNYFLVIGPKELKFQCDGGYPGDVIRKFGEDIFIL